MLDKRLNKIVAKRHKHRTESPARKQSQNEKSAKIAVVRRQSVNKLKHRHCLTWKSESKKTLRTVHKHMHKQKPGHQIIQFSLLTLSVRVHLVCWCAFLFAIKVKSSWCVHLVAKLSGDGGTCCHAGVHHSLRSHIVPEWVRLSHTHTRCKTTWSSNATININEFYANERKLHLIDFIFHMLFY